MAFLGEACGTTFLGEGLSPGGRNRPAVRPVLMLSYHFPPLGGSGSMRVLRLSRYLPESGWKPILVSVAGGGREPRDPGLLEQVPPEVEVHRVPCLEPDDYSDSWSNPPQKIVRNLFKTFDFLLFPDDRALWIGPAASRALRLAEEVHPAVLWATGPPFSTMVAALRVHRKTGLPLVLDFRDDWTGFNARFRSRDAARQAREEDLERECLAAASAIVSVTPGIVEALRQRRPEGVPAERFHLLPNGFDPAHFTIPPPPRHSGTWRIVHAGSLYSARSPEPFLEGLRRWLAASPAERSQQVRVRFLGRVEPSLEPLFQAADLEEIVERVPFLPHAQALEQVQKADLLLLIVDQVERADQIYTGKVFEYLGSGRPILALVPKETPLAGLLVESGVGMLAPPQDPEAIARALETAWSQRESPPLPEAEVLARFDARAQARRLAALLEEAAGG